MTDLIRLNPLGIGEGFELNDLAAVQVNYLGSLNPLGIGEGFELLSPFVTKLVSVLIP